LLAQRLTLSWLVQDPTLSPQWSRLRRDDRAEFDLRGVRLFYLPFYYSISNENGKLTSQRKFYDILKSLTQNVIEPSCPQASAGRPGKIKAEALGMQGR